MLHTMFREKWPTGSGEDFLVFFIFCGRVCHLGHVTQISLSNFGSPYPWILYIKFYFDWPNGFREEDLEKIFECFLRYMGVAAMLVM